MLERDTVEEWLAEEGVETADVEITAGADEWDWWTSYVGGAFRTIVAHKGGERGHGHLHIGLRIDDSHREALRALDDDTLERFGYDLRMEIARQRVGVSWDVGEGDDLRTLNQVSFFLNLFDEPVTKGVLFRRNYQLQSSAQLVAFMFQKLARFQTW